MWRRRPASGRIFSGAAANTHRRRFAAIRRMRAHQIRIRRFPGKTSYTYQKMSSTSLGGVRPGIPGDGRRARTARTGDLDERPVRTVGLYLRGRAPRWFYPADGLAPGWRFQTKPATYR